MRPLRPISPLFLETSIKIMIQPKGVCVEQLLVCGAENLQPQAGCNRHPARGRSRLQKALWACSLCVLMRRCASARPRRPAVRNDACSPRHHRYRHGSSIGHGRRGNSAALSLCCLPATGRDACPQGTCPDATSDSDVAPDHRNPWNAIEAIFSIEVGTPSRPHPPFSAVPQRWPGSTDAKATICLRLRQQQVAESKAMESS